MYTSSVFLTSLFALMATATPIDNTLIQRGSESTFNINVWNNCPFTKQFAPKQTHTIVAPYNDIGMRLSGHAEWGTDRQWEHQALFEFGYSQYNGQDGTAYNLSLMTGTDLDIGLGAYPISNGNGSDQCPSKTCFPWDCPLAQGWTNPDQTKDGSPADTVCYKGKTDFKVVFCP
jgi:hypothetical protein